VQQGLKGKSVAEICLEHQISQTLYYKWRDQLLANVHQVFTDKEKKHGWKTLMMPSTYNSRMEYVKRVYISCETMAANRHRWAL
jgi:transposase-like protein